MEIADGVGLYAGRVLPTKTKSGEALLHCARGETDLVPDTVGRQITVTHDAFRIGARTFARLGSASDHETRRRRLARPGEGERIERRLGRRIDLRTDIAARHRVGGAVIDAPFGQGLHI